MAEVAPETMVDGRYRVLSRLGSGGMADVYCAEDTHLGRQVAIKVLHRRFAQDQEFVERFRREASAAAGLQHPNVVGVFDRGRHDGTYYIAMEYLTGRTLKEIVESEAPLAQERVVDFGLQVLHGREADEPGLGELAELAHLGSARLARHRDAAEGGGSAGALLHHAAHHVGELLGGLGLHRL